MLLTQLGSLLFVCKYLLDISMFDYIKVSEKYLDVNGLKTVFGIYKETVCF